jgi:hypothetical protein
MARPFVAVRPDDAAWALLGESTAVTRSNIDGVRWMPPEQ